MDYLVCGEGALRVVVAQPAGDNGNWKAAAAQREGEIRKDFTGGRVIRVEVPIEKYNAPWTWTWTVRCCERCLAGRSSKRWRWRLADLGNALRSNYVLLRCVVAGG